MESREVVAGTVIVREGDLGDDFFIIQARRIFLFVIQSFVIQLACDLV
jgi:hypothetical protein